MGEGEDEGANYLTVAKVRKGGCYGGPLTALLSTKADWLLRGRCCEQVSGNTVMVLRSRGSEIVIEPLGSTAGATGDASTRSSTSRPALG